jgi:3-oxoacyl-[acyl-carrier protein] reductase
LNSSAFPSGLTLTGKTAIVTGAARGIGRALSWGLAKAGAAVVVADIDERGGESTATEIRSTGGRVVFAQADLRNEDEILSLVDTAITAFSRLDIVINNARPRLQRLPFQESMKEWDLAIGTLLKGPALIIQHSIGAMMDSGGGGSIVNISSTNARFVSSQPVSYHVAKAGLIQLTRCLAAEYGPYGVRVNAVAPGLVDIDEPQRGLMRDPLNIETIRQTVPLKRAGSVSDIENAVLFLCSDCSQYITGQVLTVDGGMTLPDHFDLVRRTHNKIK